MSIADELNHLAGDIGDAYDAVDDMGGVIPAAKNMDNLDTAIRTIPQPTVNDGTLTIQKNGTSVATFTANQASNVTANITVPTNTSDLNNDSGFITSSSLPGDMTGATSGTAGAHGLVPAPAAGDETKFLSGAGTWMAVSSGGSYSAGNGINIDANNEISIDTTVVAEVSDIPTQTSDLTNDGADGTSTYVEADELATVATTGSYTDLTNTPSIPAAQVNSDWNAVSGVAEILNKPSLATVATTGAYSDLSGTPTIPTVNDATLTITQNGTSAGTFTANSSTNTTIALTDTTYSAFTGTDGVSAGTTGLVPAPATTDAGKFLKADGTWDTAGGSWAGSKVYYGTISGYSAQLKTVTVQNDFTEAVGNVMVLYCSSQNIFESGGSTAYRMRINGANTTDWVYPFSNQDGRWDAGDTIVLTCYSVDSNGSGSWHVSSMNIANTDFYGEVKIGSGYTSNSAATVPTNAQLYSVYTLADGKQNALTAGTGITIDANNVISASATQNNISSGDWSALWQ